MVTTCSLDHIQIEVTFSIRERKRKLKKKIWGSAKVKQSWQGEFSSVKDHSLIKFSQRETPLSNDIRESCLVERHKKLPDILDAFL